MSSPTARPLVLSYLGLRRAVGVLGLLLPVVLVGGGLLTGEPVAPSLSAYYYTGFRDVLVGTLVAIGVFLFSYRVARADAWFSSLAGLAAVVVALAPTTPVATSPTEVQDVVGRVHYVAAAVFFVALAVFCLWLFPRDEARGTPGRVPRAIFYRIAGLVILAAIGAAAYDVVVLRTGPPTPGFSPLLAFETVAVWAFGASWLVKGAALRSESGTAART